MFALVVAKEPRPGRVKTRLCPPFSPTEAAEAAAAALADTMNAVMACGADEVIVALDGRPGDWLPAGVRVVPQIEGPFDRRLAAAWAATNGPGIQIGMDTPQVTAGILGDAFDALAGPGVDAVLGPAVDGGWWAIGLHEADPRVFLDVPMSRTDTGARQRERLTALDLRVADLVPLVDVDDVDDARIVAALIPGSRFAAVVGRALAGSGRVAAVSA